MKLFLLAWCALLTASFGATARAQDGRAHPLLRSETLARTLGVNIHFTDAAPGELEMLRAGGFRRARMDFSWSATETARGQYDFAAYDRLLAALDKNGVGAYFILGYGNPLYSRDGAHPFTEGADSDAYRAAYAKWAAAAVAHFRGRGVVWEIWNEPNISNFWKPAPDVKVYSALALAACRAIRAVAPDECIIGPATSGVDLGFIEGCLRAGLLEFWDGVSVHPYRRSAPESAAADYRELRALIERTKPAGKTVPIVSGEWGYSSVWPNFDAARQGRYLPRQWLFNASQNIPVSIWYDWRDDGPDPDESEFNFGTVLHAPRAGGDPIYQAKPAYLAAQTLARELDGFAFNKRLWTGREEDWVLLFERGNAQKLACWTTDATPHSLSLPVSDGAFARADYLGQTLPALAASGGQLALELSENAQYLSPRRFNAQLARAAMWPRLPFETPVSAPAFAKPVGGGAPLRIWRDTPALFFVETLGDYAQIGTVRVSNPLSATPLAPVGGRVAVQLSNPTGAPLRAQLMVWNGPKMTRQSFELSAGETEKTVAVALANRAAPAAGSPIGSAAGSPVSSLVGVQIADATGAPLTARHDARFVALADFPRAADLIAAPSGDAGVASTQSASLENAFEPPPGLSAPVVKLNYSWDAGWKFVTLPAPAAAAIVGAPRAIQMWIYGDGNGHRARLRVRDASGQTLQPDGVAVGWKGWRAVNFSLRGESVGHWGGANDGQIHGALTWENLLLLDSTGSASQGAIYLAAPTLVYDATS